MDACKTPAVASLSATASTPSGESSQMISSSDTARANEDGRDHPAIDAPTIAILISIRSSFLRFFPLLQRQMYPLVFLSIEVTQHLSISTCHLIDILTLIMQSPHRNDSHSGVIFLPFLIADSTILHPLSLRLRHSLRQRINGS